VPIRLPSERIVWLRGKMDGVNVVTKVKQHAGVWLQENKTKGDVNREKIMRQLRFDFQTMFYLTVLDLLQQYASEATEFDTEKSKVPTVSEWCGFKLPKGNPRGVMYNVIKRPLSGGKGTIVQKKGSKNVPPETKAEYYARVAQYIKDEPAEFFMRWDSIVPHTDIETFKTRCLFPILEELCNWWSWMETNPPDPFDKEMLQHGCAHWQHPYGIFNVLNEGGSTDLDEYLETGSTLGLQRTTNLFPEL
jgi:hypothetical protein